MKYLLGSHFWGMNIEDSDKDYLEFVLPTKEDLFWGKFKSTCTKDENGNDVNIKDIRLILKELKKGSLRMFEMMYAPVVDYHEENNLILKTIEKYLQSNRDKLFEELRIEFMRAVIGESKGRINSLEKNFTGKELAHLQKLYWLLYLTHKYKNPFHIMLSDTNKQTLKKIRLNSDKTLFETLKEEFKFGYYIDFGKPIDDKPVLNELENMMITIIR